MKYYQSFFDEIVDGECDEDESGAECEEVPPGDVLKKLHRPELRAVQNAAGRRKLKNQSETNCLN